MQQQRAGSNSIQNSSSSKTPKEITLPSVNTKTFVPRRPLHSHHHHHDRQSPAAGGTERQQQPQKENYITHRVVAVGKSLSRQSLPSPSSERQHDAISSTDASYQDSRRIRKVQSESLAELPYLSMTEGYEC
jgi:hypothetical protein